VADRILVTGGCGFVGTNLVRQLVTEGKTVRVIDNLQSGDADYLRGLDVEIIEADIRSAEQLEQSMRSVGAVVHLAAAGSVVDSVADPVGNFQSNVMGTFAVLNAARTAGVERLVFSSTGGALIGDATPPVNEQSLPKPISPYGASKLAAEAYCHAFAKSYGLGAVSLRFANVYGPYSGHKKGAVTTFLRLLWRGEPLVVYGDGSASRDFMYVEDICNGIRLALDAGLAGGTVVHLATGVETTVTELADACRKVSGRPAHVIEHRPNRPGEVARNFATYDRARELLGFEPKVSLDEGLAATWDWFTDHVFDA
jgi:UDP-glucose 4-epimerase